MELGKCVFLTYCEVTLFSINFHAKLTQKHGKYSVLNVVN